MAKKATLQIRQVKSKIGQSRRQQETLLTLGLRRIGQVVERPDNPAVRGAVRAVGHLVRVEDASGEAAVASAPVTEPKAAPKKVTKTAAKKTTKKAAKTTKKAAKKTTKKTAKAAKSGKAKTASKKKKTTKKKASKS